MTDPRTMMSPEELALIGTPCTVCGEPLTAQTVFVYGMTCGSCQDGHGPDRLPRLHVMTMCLIPMFSH